MRTVFDPQLTLGQVDVADIKLDPKSLDDIPQLLRGLQHLHAEPELRQRVFAILAGLWWAIHRGQFEDIEAEGERILRDD